MYTGDELSLVSEKAAPACLPASKLLISVARKGGSAFSGQLNLGALRQFFI